jgi:hypothetical protein
MATKVEPPRLTPRFSQPASTKTTQIKFRLSESLYQKIQGAGERNGWGASEEIRRRLEDSFFEDPLLDDEETSQMLVAIKYATRNARSPFGLWHENRFAFDVVRAAINIILDLFRPPGDPIRPSNHWADFFLGDDGKPETAGRTLASIGAIYGNIPLPGTDKEIEPSEAGAKG